jgi:hypothetical protein
MKTIRPLNAPAGCRVAGAIGPNGCGIGGDGGGTIVSAQSDDCCVGGSIDSSTNRSSWATSCASPIDASTPRKTAALQTRWQNVSTSVVTIQRDAEGGGRLEERILIAQESS